MSAGSDKAAATVFGVAWTIVFQEFWLFSLISGRLDLFLYCLKGDLSIAFKLVEGSGWFFNFV